MGYEKLDFSNLVDMACSRVSGSKEIDCDIRLEVNGKEYRAYSVSVANQDLLFFTDKGTVNRLIDNYSGYQVAELFDYELEDQE